MSDAVVQLLVALGAGGILTAAVNGYLNRRKLGAEATDIITKAAASTVKDVREDNTRLRQEVADLRAEVESLKAREDVHDRGDRAWRDLLMLHAAFDHVVITKLAEHGITGMPEPPPLYPPPTLEGGR